MSQREALAVTSAAFAQYLSIVGLSETTLSRFYEGNTYEGKRVWRARRPHSFPLAVALSGGADSMALMLLLREFMCAHGIETPLLAITIDHQLRPESADEARHVGAICTERWQVKHMIAQCEWDRHPEQQGSPRKSKLQEAARAYRYELLTDVCREHGVRCLFVAHNLGDQLETMLFRLGRASGINGIAGIAPSSVLHGKAGDLDAIHLLRPLMEVSKASMKATCKRFVQDWVEDPSNESLVYDRIRIRKELERLEVENEDGPELIQMLSDFQLAAARAKEEFTQAEQALLHKHSKVECPDLVVLSSTILSDESAFDELLIRVLSEIVRSVGRKDTPPRLSSLQGLLHDLRRLGSGKKVTLSGCCVMKKERGQELHFYPEHHHC
ncbi:hypothetical protein Poli38472_006181 [Pythium oligandrum]|uniref:tRNA(Ile)-lysidine synthetase n=1 Tax=Pythium oligandrum TaxID=41045 RepID=A0A8K1FSM8_PYTOL|nr:hypothetical protein Poli38472_006181 [Pythium oligandrum]|eukprot:TMW68713.1 hypothetical protein Poli38472_006181 [Pythium oligandrum]